MIDLSTPDDRLAAAGEYVLGTLDAADEAAFIAAMAHDETLLAAVYGWQDRLLALSLQAAPALPRPQLWQRIDVALNAMAMPAASATSASARPAVPPLRWWQRALPWQGFGAAAFAAAVLMAVVLLRGAPAPLHERYLAVLQSPLDRSAGWVVEIEADRALRLLPLGDTAAPPAGKSLQFWTKPQGAAGPTSLGLVAAGRTVEMPAARLPGVGEQQLFEITLEPENGSPLGRPTGPILYVGRTVHL